ncbi:DUF6680 family protein [Variovorax humicola]|uniref:DUF6680 family protein n=1 Tax=Variovorax humicola TaxID=1769758 RepID=A0ABU8VUE9_9BURK
MFDFSSPLKLADIATIAVTFLSPFFAVQASEWLRSRARDYESREQVFHTLMSTRKARMAPMHVGALNRIDLVFPAKRFPKVSDAWNFYLAHLMMDQGTTDAEIKAWLKVSDDRFFPLLRAMAAAQKVSFTDTSMQHNGYYPMGYVFSEGQQQEVRAAALEVLRGDRAIAIKAAPSPKQG